MVRSTTQRSGRDPWDSDRFLASQRGFDQTRVNQHERKHPGQPIRTAGAGNLDTSNEQGFRLIRSAYSPLDSAFAARMLLTKINLAPPSTNHLL